MFGINFHETSLDRAFALNVCVSICERADDRFARHAKQVGEGQCHSLVLALKVLVETSSRTVMVFVVRNIHTKHTR